MRIGLSRGLRLQEGVAWDLWENARDCYDAYAPGRSLRPDGYFRFWQRETLHSFFLEVDRGTVSLARWKGKVERYLDYREGGAYRERYGLSRFRVLVTAPTPKRLSHLLEATREATDRSFWFGLTEEVARIDPKQTLWQPVGGGERRALLSEGVGA